MARQATRLLAAGATNIASFGPRARDCRAVGCCHVDGRGGSYRNFAGFRGDARLGTWLHRIVVNAALGRLRRRKRRPEHGAEVVDVTELLPRFRENGYPEHFHEPWVQPAEELATRAETREQVRQMIDKLPENYRTVLILRDIEELSTAETSELLELSPGTVKVRLHRARQALRNLIERELELTHRE